MFVRLAADLPEQVAGIRVGAVLIVRDEEHVEAIAAICSGCLFRVVLSSELDARK